MIFRRFYISFAIVLFLVLKGACEDIEPKSSIAFVIDKTLSMGPVINGVKSQVGKIFETVTSSPESPIENFVLVLFGDPNVSDALVTTDREEFKSALGSIILEDGGNCPELAMTGIKTALDACSRGSYVYIFTDASADDFDKFKQVKDIAQEKESQVVFVLTSKCPNSTELSENYIVYSNLAEATSGQVFHTNEKEIDGILKYVKHSITSRRATLYSKKYLAGNNSLDIEADSKTKDLTVAITATDRANGADIKAYITDKADPDGETIDEAALVRMGDILILKVSESIPGIYLVSFSCKVPSYVVVTARTDVRFRHGFSTSLVTSLNDTTIRPVAAMKNYLTIKLFGNNVRLTSVKLLSKSYIKLLELPLKLKDVKEKLYVTELFDLPSSKFRIAVHGVDTETNTNLTRFGALVLETEKFEAKRPTVNITGHSKEPVDYDGGLHIICTVDAYPEPKIMWRELEGKELSSILVQEPPYYSYRTLELKNLTMSKTYECYAENRLGKDTKNVHVEVNPKKYITEIQRPKSLDLPYGAKGVLHCEVNSYPPARISWIFEKNKRAIIKHGNVVLSPDNSTLTIKEMNTRASGKYGCKVDYLNSTKILSYATITLSDSKSFCDGD